MGIKERLIDFIKYKGVSRSEFERKSQLSNGYINNIRDGMGADKLENVLRAYPELNRSWLLTGEGEMLNPVSNVATANGNSSVAAINSHVVNGGVEILQERVKHLEELLAEKERLIQVLMEGRK